MSVANMKMKNAFIDWVVPSLTERSFRGVFPNYRRNTDEQIDIISLQFSLFDHAFCVGIANCPKDGITFSNGKRIPGNLVTANHCPGRFLLGTKDGDFAHWFKFKPSIYELKRKHEFSYWTMYEDTPTKYRKIADDIVRLIDLEADPWWLKAEKWWNHHVPVYNTLFWDIQRLTFKMFYE